MELTSENRRTRAWIVAAACAFAALLLVLHATAMQDYVDLVGGLGRRGAEELNTPLQRTIPHLFADTQTWTRHALALLETDAWRIRFTEIDNAPHGRPVHWNSAFTWLIAAAGWLRQSVTGEPLPLAVERALGWFNVPLLLAVIALFAGWTARRAGAAAGCLVALAMVGSTEFSNGFTPSFVDHHGILAAANFGLVLGGVFMGAGWFRARETDGFSLLPADRAAARSAVLFSALSGAAGMWISAASVIPGIAIVGIAGLVATLWQGRALRAAGAVFDGGLWRLWGRVGGGASLLFYFLEYAPGHMEWRLEVNHPLLALAWWGGGELVAGIGELRVASRPHAGALPRLLLAMAAIAAAPATVLAAGAKVFVIRDPMILQISARVAEGLTLPEAMRLIGPIVGWLRLPWALVSLVPALFLMTRRRAAGDRLVIAFASLMVLAFLAMGFFQIRFFANAGGPQIALLLVVIAAGTRTWAPSRRWPLVLATIIVLCLPERLYRIVELNQSVAQRIVSRDDLLQPLYRDIAAALRRTQPGGEIILLTNPDASTSVGYYGRLATIGTLYWENLDGIKAAAAIHAATSMDEARALMVARRVTHVAVISEASFVREYYELAHPAVAPDAWKSSVGYQLFAGQNLPLWLEPIAYEPPADIKIPNLRVVLFRTRFGPPAAEELFRAAGEKARAGDLATAEAALDRAIAQDGTVPEFLKMKAELLIARGALEAAAVAMDKTLAAAPSSHRAELAQSAAGIFYQGGLHAAAARFYRTSLEQRYDAVVASNLGWILATSRDAAVRDGKAALALGRRVAGENPQSFAFASTLAAALAENGLLPEAVRTASVALDLARAAGNTEASAVAEQRLRAYRAGRPWRE